MTRKDLLTLSPRLARRALVKHITLSLDRLPDTQSDLYVIRGSCGLCPVACSLSFTTPGVLSCASADAFVDGLFSLCKSLGDLDTVFHGLVGPRAAISAVSEEDK